MLKRIFRNDRAETPSVAPALAKTRASWRDRLLGVFGPVDITERTWADLEVHLIQADMGAAAAEYLVRELRTAARDQRVNRADELWSVLRQAMIGILEHDRDVTEPSPTAGQSAGIAGGAWPDNGPYVIMMVGVNGTGKTTTIAKLAHRLRAADHNVLLVAADTFRAAASEQLQEWGRRVGVPVVAATSGADPAALVFDALSSGAAQRADVVIIDTAGRLHTQTNLMGELQKIHRICGRVVPDAPHATLLVLDATTGQNGVAQARSFAQAIGIDALILAKLDSSARGGVAFSIRRELDLPIAFVGTGEGLADLQPFDAGAYVDGILAASEKMEVNVR